MKTIPSFVLALSLLIVPVSSQNSFEPYIISSVATLSKNIPKVQYIDFGYSAKEIVPEHIVKVYYFYPNDYQPDPRYVEAIAIFVEEIRLWFKEKSGETFKSVPAQIMAGKNNAEDYKKDGPAWANIYKELGINCDTKEVALIFVARTIEHGNGRSCSSDWYHADNNGDVTVSEATFDAEIIASETGVCANGFALGDWRCSANAQRGGIAHELGHAFSLSHPHGCDSSGLDYCDRSVMWSWWNWPDVGFIEEEHTPELSTLHKSEWLY